MQAADVFDLNSRQIPVPAMSRSLWTELHFNLLGQLRWHSDVISYHTSMVSLQASNC